MESKYSQKIQSGKLFIDNAIFNRNLFNKQKYLYCSLCDVKEKRKPFGLPLIKNSQDQNKTPTSLIFA